MAEFMTTPVVQLNGDIWQGPNGNPTAVNRTEFGNPLLQGRYRYGN